MVTPLTDKVNELRQKAEQKNSSFAVVESKSENMVVVVINSIPAMLLVPPEKNNNMIFPMKVNLSKWAWAIEEGFESQDIFDLNNVGEEIFIPTNEKNMLEYLKLN